MLASNLEKHYLARFRAQLGVRAADLKRRIAAAREGDVDMGAGVHDTKDQSAAQAAEAVRSADLGREKAELADMELALARIDLGTYGICCDCARPIGRKRLEAYPAAKRCSDCQQAHEQRSGRPARH